MKDLVFIKKEQVFTTSLKVAEIFEKKHKNVIQTIENSISNLQQINGLKNQPVKKSFVKSSYKDAKGEMRPMYYLNRDAFSFVVMGFTGAKAAEWKWNYIQAFNQMENALSKILAERQTTKWQQARLDSKISTRRMTDAIKNALIPLALKQGMDEKKINFLYNNYNRLINKCAGVKADSRELLTSKQLYEMDKMSNIAGILIEKYVVQEIDYHEIYFKVKDYLFDYVKISMM